jgi:hypothetical protein
LLQPELVFTIDQVDYVRLYQRESSISIGCSTPDYPSDEYITNNLEKYVLSTWPDYPTVVKAANSASVSEKPFFILSKIIFSFCYV